MIVHVSVYEFTARPGMFNMRDRAKWDAWKAVEGKYKLQFQV